MESGYGLIPIQWPVLAESDLSARLVGGLRVPTTYSKYPFYCVGLFGNRKWLYHILWRRLRAMLLAMLRVYIPVVAFLLLHAITSAGPQDSAVAAIAHQVPDQAFDAQVLMIGETHRKARSHSLTWALIQRALAYHECVVFALEIPSDGRGEWRRAATQVESIDEIGISPIHASQSLRRLMVRTSELARKKCLNLRAIDVPDKPAIAIPERDEYMARQLNRIVRNGRFVIALVGSLHAVRHLDWAHGQPGKPVSYLVSEAGSSVYVLVQDWAEGLEEPHVYTQDSEASIAVINNLHWFADLVPASSFERYADMLVVWPSGDSRSRGR